MKTYDDQLDEPPDTRIPCEDCEVRLDHHTGFLRLWRRGRDIYCCQSCGEAWLSREHQEVDHDD